MSATEKVSASVSVHEPVLLHEIVDNLVGETPYVIGGEKLITKSEFWYLDGTLGGAGHALAIAKAFVRVYASNTDISVKLNIIGLDQDPQAIERDRDILSQATKGKLILENENFRNMDKVLTKIGVEKVDLILLDLGISSDELDNSGKGFTFQKDEPLFMTMADPDKHAFTAKDIVNSWKEEDIANVIFAYGEDRFARRIARKIIQYRDKKKIETSMELAEIVKSAVPFGGRGFGGKKKIHPATKTFQALRIAVNDELGALREGLKKGFDSLASGGKMAVISFHSLEDRIVKEYFRSLTNHFDKKDKTDFYKKDKEEKRVATILTKKPIVASVQEIAENPRSRSAKLRIIQKI